MKKLKKNKGITLVALVVTIVVLLILAGVSVVTLFGESGIITAAQKAKNLTEAGVSNDLAGLEDLEEYIEDSLDNTPKIAKGEMVDKGTKVAKYIENGTNSKAYIPGGYCVVKDSSTDSNTIANGLVISDLAGDTLDNEPIKGVRGNQFVWVPVPDITTMYDEANKAGKLYDYGTYNSSTKTWTAFVSPTPKVYPIIQNDGSREPDVVTESFDESDSTTGESYDALVTNLNVITDFKVGEGKIKSAALFKKYLQDEFDRMIESVKKYKGFYIGRYETGNLSATNNKQKAVVQKGNDNINNVNWYYQYQEIKNMTADNSNVTTSMIWGCQWDRTLNWFIKTGTQIADIVDSTSWGNYKDNTETGHGSIQTSGYNKAWQKNHIYDMAGNVNDWTMETIYNYGRTQRGGYYKESGSFLPAFRRTSESPVTTSLNFGSRSTLYVNP